MSVAKGEDAGWIEEKERCTTDEGEKLLQ